MKKLTRAAFWPLFPVRYKTLPQLLNLIGQCNQRSLVGKFAVVKDLRHICVIDVRAFPEQLAVYLNGWYSLIQSLFIMARASIDEERKEKVIVDIFCK